MEFYSNIYNGSDVFTSFRKEMVLNSSIDSKRILLLGYIGLHSNLTGALIITINELVMQLGYTPNRNKGRIIDQIKKHLLWLEQESYMFASKDLNAIGNSTCFEIQINPERNIFSMTNIDDHGNTTVCPYIKLPFSAFHKITHAKTTVDKGRLLRVYLVIRSYLDESSDMQRYVFPSIETIAGNIGVSKGTNICKAIDELEGMGVLFTYNAGSYIDLDNKRKNINTFYAFEPKSFKGANHTALNYLKKKGLIIDQLDKKVERVKLNNYMNTVDKERGISMKRFCMECMKEVDTVNHKKSETYEIKGQEITAESQLVYCKECDAQLFDRKIENENIERFKRKYQDLNESKNSLPHNADDDFPDIY